MKLQIQEMKISVSGDNELIEDFFFKTWSESRIALSNVKKSVLERLKQQFRIFVEWIEDKNENPTATLTIVFSTELTHDNVSEVLANMKPNQNTLKRIVQECLQSSTNSFLKQLKIDKVIDGTKYPVVHNIENVNLLKTHFPSESQKLSSIMADYIKDARIIRKIRGGFNLVHIYDNQRIVRISKDGSRKKGLSNTELVTASNWEKAARYNITPRIFWQGYVNIDIPFDRELKKSKLPHFVVIMEAYDMNMRKFVEQNLHKPNGRTIVQDLVQKVTKKTWDFTTMLYIGCIDTKPENIVVRRLPHDQIDVRLIDLEGDFCQRNNAPDQVALRGNTYGAFVVSICLLALHCIEIFNDNLFFPVLNDLKSRSHNNAYLPNNMPHISVSQIERAYNILGAHKQVRRYFEIDTFEEFWGSSNCHIVSLPESMPSATGDSEILHGSRRTAMKSSKDSSTSTRDSGTSSTSTSSTSSSREIRSVF